MAVKQYQVNPYVVLLMVVAWELLITHQQLMVDIAGVK